MMVMLTLATALSINWDQKADVGMGTVRETGGPWPHRVARWDPEQPLQHARQGAEEDRQDELY